MYIMSTLVHLLNEYVLKHIDEKYLINYGKPKKREVFIFLQEDNIIPEILVVTGLKFAWEFFLNIRQISLMERLKTRPSYLASIMPEADYNKSRAYAIDTMRLTMSVRLCDTIYTILDLLLGGSLFIWAMSEKLVDYWGYDPHNEIVTSAGCMLIIITVNTIFYVPFSIYETFVLEEKYGFNKTNPRTYVNDFIRSFIVGAIIIIPIVCGLIWIVQHSDTYALIYTSFFLTIVDIIFALISFNIMGRIFNMSPLPDGDLKDKIEELARLVEFPLEGIYIMETSSRTQHSNAFFAGMFKYKRIVLTDTLVKDYRRHSDRTGSSNTDAGRGCTADEIVGVVAHELGHWHYSHVSSDILIAQLYHIYILIAYSFLWDYETLYYAFGFVDKQPILIRMLIIGYVLSPINEIINWKLNSTSRWNELRADLYAKELGHGEALKQALCKLYKDNLTYPIYDHLYSSWYFEHPQLLERLQTLS